MRPCKHSSSWKVAVRMEVEHLEEMEEEMNQDMTWSHTQEISHPEAE